MSVVVIVSLVGRLYICMPQCSIKHDFLNNILILPLISVMDRKVVFVLVVTLSFHHPPKRRRQERSSLQGFSLYIYA